MRGSKSSTVRTPSFLDITPPDRQTHPLSPQPRLINPLPQTEDFASPRTEPEAPFDRPAADEPEPTPILLSERLAQMTAAAATHKRPHPQQDAFTFDDWVDAELDGAQTFSEPGAPTGTAQDDIAQDDMAEDEDWLELTDPLPKPARAAPQAAYAEPADAWSPVRPVTAQDPVQASLHRFVDEFQRRQDQANLLVAGGIGAAVVLTLIALSAYLSLGG